MVSTSTISSPVTFIIRTAITATTTDPSLSGSRGPWFETPLESQAGRHVDLHFWGRLMSADASTPFRAILDDAKSDTRLNDAIAIETRSILRPREFLKGQARRPRLALSFKPLRTLRALAHRSSFSRLGRLTQPASPGKAREPQWQCGGSTMWQKRQHSSSEVQKPSVRHCASTQILE